MRMHERMRLDTELRRSDVVGLAIEYGDAAVVRRFFVLCVGACMRVFMLYAMSLCVHTRICAALRP